MSVKLLTEHNLEFLSLIGGCTGSSESTLLKVHNVGNHMSRLNFKKNWLNVSEYLLELKSVYAYSVQNFHLGRYIVAYTVGNLVSLRPTCERNVTYLLTPNYVRQYIALPQIADVIQSRRRVTKASALE